MANELRVYIIYSRQDGHGHARAIRDALLGSGVPAGYHTGGSPIATHSSDGIQGMISQATDILVCVTRGISRDPIAMDELGRAQAAGKRLIALEIDQGSLPRAISVNERLTFRSDVASLEKVVGLLRPAEPSAASDTEREIEYLQALTERFSHWPELYTEIEGRLRVDPVATDFASETAAAYIVHIGSAPVGTALALDPDEGSSKPLGTFADLFDALARPGKFAIVGEPGSGKSATLEHLAREFAVRRLSNGGEVPIPLLADLAAYEGGSIVRFFEEHFGGLMYARYKVSEVVLLLDGLNEMVATARAEFVAWINGPTPVRAIVTCRTADFAQERISLQRIDLLPFDVQRIFRLISRFLDRSSADALFWSLAGRRASDSWTWLRSERPNSTLVDYWYGDIGRCPSWEIPRFYLHQIQRNLRETGELPGLLGIVRNPLLLLIAVRLYAQTGSLPENRGKLFEQFVRLLISRQSLAGGSEPVVSEETEMRILSYLAVDLLESGRGTRMTRLRAIEVIRGTSLTETPEGLLRVAGDAGLLEVRSHVRFSHQLLQEYFASYALEREMRAGATADRYWPGHRWWETTGWEEPAILLAGLHGDASGVVEWLRLINPTLAFRCATESGARCAPSVLDKVVNPSGDSRHCPIARAVWGRDVAAQDDRLGVGVLSTESNVAGTPGGIIWCEVPPGESTMGGDAYAWNSSPATSVTISYPFWLAKFPTTYAQYNLFVEAGGYADDRLWSAPGLEWRGTRQAPRYWEDPRYHMLNHPVVGISWFEASAFAAWVSEKVDAADGGSLSVHVRLPTESEWERAARYPDTRNFPWGDEYIPGSANIDETDDSRKVGPYSLRRTTAVGLYPSGTNPALGIWDLAGTVWEWCQTKWSPVPGPGHEDNSSDGVENRVLRGGSWSNNEFLARSSSRHHYPPTDNGDRRGVRLCLVKLPTR